MTLAESGDTAERLLFALARNFGQAATYGTLLRDVSDPSAGVGVSEATLVSYLELFRDLYLLEEIPGWLPPARSPKRVRTKPKRYLVDPSLAVAELGISPEGLLLSESAREVEDGPYVIPTRALTV